MRPPTAFQPGMADVHGGRERTAQHRAHDRAETVGEQDLAQVVVVAGGRGALDVVHRLGEVVDAERDRGDEQRRDLRESRPDIGREDRNVQAEMSERFAHGGGLHVVAPSGERHRPADHGADDHGGESAGEPARESDIPRPRDQHDREAHEPDPRRLPHLERRAHRDERDRDSRQRSQHRRARRHRADHRTDERAGQHDDADDEAPGEAGVPRDDRVLRLQVRRQHDQEHDDEHVRHARAVRHRGHVAAALFLRELIREIRVEQVAERQRDAQRGQDAAEHRVGRQLDDPEAEAGQHDHVQQHVGEQPEESVPVARHPQANIAVGRRRIHGFVSPVVGVVPRPRSATYARQPPYVVISRLPSHRNGSPSTPENHRSILQQHLADRESRRLAQQHFREAVVRNVPQLDGDARPLTRRAQHRRMAVVDRPQPIARVRRVFADERRADLQQIRIEREAAHQRAVDCQQRSLHGFMRLRVGEVAGMSWRSIPSVRGSDRLPPHGTWRWAAL